MARKVLYTGTHSVSGSFTMPNGATGYGRAPATGPGWSATCLIGGAFDTCSFEAHSIGPEYRQNGSPYDAVGASVTVGTGQGAVTASLNFDEFSYSSFPLLGRGVQGDTISGTFSFSVPAELVLYTGLLRELPDPSIPDDLYPFYGGERTPGEYPETDAWLAWEPIAGASTTGTVTLGGKSATATGANGNFTSSATFGVNLFHSPGAAGSSGFTPAGVCRASINFNGYPVDATGVSKSYSYQGSTNMTASVQSGGATASIDTGVGGVPSGGVGGISAGGSISVPRKAAVALDAYAMAYPHPYACVWKAVLKYKDAGEVADADGFFPLIDPPEPIVTTLTGQAVSADVLQRAENLNAVAQQKAFDAVSRSGGRPVRGVDRNGNFRTYDDYRNEFGPVRSWLVPPPGEDAKDWRVGWRGREFDALNVAHAATLNVSLPSGSASGSDTLYSFDPPSIWEGYRFAEITHDADAIQVGGKRWALSSSPQTIDLCFPDAGGPAFDRQNTRFPLDEDRRSTIETPLWGITLAEVVRAVGGTISGIVLKEGSAGAKVHALAPFFPRETEVPDDTVNESNDSYTVQHECVRLLILDVDGRQGHEIPHVRITINNAPGRAYTTDYAHLPVSALPGLFAEVPGCLASSASLDAGAEPAYFMGLGYTLQNGVWTKGFDRATGTLKGQPVYDSLEWPGDVQQDVFNLGGGGSGLKLAGRKVLRSAAYGAIRDTATVYLSSLPSGDEGTATVLGKRYGLAGPTLSPSNLWGRVWVDPAHKASFGGTPRLIERGAFGTPTQNPGAVHLTRSLDDGAILLTKASEDGLVTTRTLNLGGTPIEGEVGEGDSAQSYIFPGQQGYYACFRSKDGVTTEAHSYDQGATWNDMPDTIPGSSPAVDVNESTGEAFAVTWTDPGWDCYWREPYNPDDAPPPFVFVAHVVDGPEKAAGLVFDPGQDGALTFAYDSGGDTQLLYNRDHGKTWTDS